MKRFQRWYFDDGGDIGFRKTPSCAYRCHYHLVFATKFRDKVLSPDAATGFVAVLLELQKERDFHLFGVYVAEDHVHVLFGLAPKETVAEIVRLMKGRTSRVLREQFPELAELPSLWTSGYWVESLGQKTIAQIKAYLDRQEEHHSLTQHRFAD